MSSIVFENIFRGKGGGGLINVYENVITAVILLHLKKKTSK